MAGLVEQIGRAQQIVGKVVAGLASVNCKPAVGRVGVALVDLNVADVATKLQRVLSNHLGEIVGDLVGVVVLTGGAVGQAEVAAQLARRNRRNTFDMRD